MEKPKGRKSWVAGKVVANLDARRKRMFEEILEHRRSLEPRTSQTNVIESAIDREYLATFSRKSPVDA